MYYIKKKVKYETEFNNLFFLRNEFPAFIPFVKNIDDDSYLIEKCQVINQQDFNPANFKNLYSNLLINFYNYKCATFTTGIYKFYSVNSLFTDKQIGFVIPYLLYELQNLINELQISDDIILKNVINEMEHSLGKYYCWKPINGYELLHGDLHIGNIVKKGNNFLFIDFEHLRFGLKELEISNFIISCLIYFQNKNTFNSKVLNDYNNIICTIDNFSLELYKSFLNYSALLFYIKAIINKNHKEISMIIAILNSIKTEC